MMKRFAILLVVVSVLILLLSGCMLNSYNKPALPSNNKPTFALGVRQLPQDFMNWWFDQLYAKQTNKATNQSKQPLKLIATDNEILNTQQLLYQPISTNLPSSYDLRDYGYVPPVGNQGAVNDCWAYSTVESLESAMLVQLGPTNIANDYPFISDPSSPNLSVQFVAYNNYEWHVYPQEGSYYLTWQETNQDNGGNHFFAFYDLTTRGVPLSSDFPYIATSQAYIQWNSTNGLWPQHLVKISYAYVIPSAQWFYNNGYSYTDYINTIKSAIVTYGAVAVDFNVYSNFEQDLNEPSGWVYSGPSSTAFLEGGHAVILIGWDNDWTYNGTDYGPVWILQNSWGTSWGDNGCWRQPMITENQFNSPNTIPGWQIESNNYGGMYVPVLQ